MDIQFLLGGSLVAVLLVEIIKTVFGKLEGKYGKLVTQAILLCVSFCVAGLGAAFKLLPQEIINTTLTITASAMLVYEVLYKAIFQNIIQGGGDK